MTANDKRAQRQAALFGFTKPKPKQPATQTPDERAAKMARLLFDRKDQTNR